MINRTFILVTLVCISCFCFAQEKKPVPFHIIKANVYNAPFGEVIGFYEYFNGKNKGWEFGLSAIYPVKPMQENLLQLYPTLFYASGFSVRCARRYCFPAGKGFIFLGPSAVFKYKNIHNSKVKLDKETDTEANISQEKYIGSVMATFGFTNPRDRKLSFEVYCALGVSHIWSNTTYNYYLVEGHPASPTEFYYREKPTLLFDRKSFFFPVVEIGYKFLFGMKKKVFSN